jgi:hypothetical protein
MFEISKVIKEFKELVEGLKKHGHIDLIEVEESSKTSHEYKFSIDTRSLDLLKKWLEVNLFIQGIAVGVSFPIYTCGPITNKKGWSVLHLKVELANLVGR